jgi:hypothetical protein
VSARERVEKFGVSGGVVVVVGPRARTLAFAVERALFDRGSSAVVLRGTDAAWRATAGAVRDAGLVAVVALDAAAGETDAASLVLESKADESPEAQARDALGAMAKRGWLK